jgi:hypothetical protein
MGEPKENQQRAIHASYVSVTKATDAASQLGAWDGRHFVSHDL